MTSLIASIFGLVVGSFLNVCIYRWPRGESVVGPRSRCPHCNSTINWYDNIPLVSYCLLKAQCRCCHEKISILYPVVELLNALLWGYLFGCNGLDPKTFKLAIFTSMMLVLIFTDLLEYILPDEITVGGLLAAAAFIPIVPIKDQFTGIVWLFVTRPAVWLVSVVESISSVLLMGGLLYGLRSAYFRIRKIEGLGLGDVKMMAMIAAFWGLIPTIMILMLGSVIGAIIGLMVIAYTQRGWQHRLPFGSYLGVSSIIVTIWGEGILSWYASFFFALPT